MFEKILQKIKTQAGTTTSVSAKSMEDMAKHYATIITTEEQLEALDFAPVLTSINGNINHNTAEAVKKVETLKQKAIDDAVALALKTKTQGTTPVETPDDAPAWAKDLQEKLNLQTQELAALKGEKVINARQDRLNVVLKNTPTYFQTPIVEAFKKATFNTEEEFEAYVGIVEKQRTDFAQSAKEQGMNVFAPSANVDKPNADGQTPELAEAMKIANQAKSK